MLKISNLTKYYGDRIILDDVSFTANNGNKIAIVGLNGAGKSTCMNIIAGRLDYNDGIIENSGSVGFMPQVLGEIDIPMNESVHDFIASARPFLDASDKAQYSNEAEMMKIIHGFKIPLSWMDKKLCELSGGQKSKVSFARTLFSAPDLLLLDEPTNHLDADSKKWAMEYIRAFQKPVIFISHDEEFLSKVANQILYLDIMTRRARFFNMGYAQFLRAKSEIADALAHQIKNQQREITKNQAFVDKYKFSFRKVKKQAQSREKMLVKMKAVAIEPPREKKNIKINFSPNRVERAVPLSVEKLYFGYDNSRDIIRSASFDLSTGEIFLVTGDNGAGKTTLLKLLAGKLKPQRGDIKFGLKTDVGYYAQEQENLDLNNTLQEEICAVRDLSESDQRGILAKFNFDDSAFRRRISTLSPGERARLSMAKLCLTGANLLLLDEPTNHLDLPTKKIIAETLNNYGGTMLIVSHDDEFLAELNITRKFILPDCKTQFV